MNTKFLFQTNNIIELYNYIYNSFNYENIPINLNEIKEKNNIWLFDGKIENFFKEFKKIEWLGSQYIIKLYIKEGKTFLKCENTEQKTPIKGKNKIKFKHLKTLFEFISNNDAIEAFEELTEEEFEENILTKYMMARNELEYIKTHILF